jgi:hypothetical protein
VASIDCGYYRKTQERKQRGTLPAPGSKANAGESEIDSAGGADGEAVDEQYGPSDPEGRREPPSDRRKFRPWCAGV